MNRFLYISVLLLFFVGCESDQELDAFFEENVVSFTLDIQDQKTSYKFGDTIWIRSEIPRSVNDLFTGEQIQLNNPTVVLSALVKRLTTTNDSIDFVSDNFTLIEEVGSLELVNVINDETVRFEFDLKYGYPDENHMLIGLVTNYYGVFAFEATGMLYYGDERIASESLYDSSSEQANIEFAFSSEVNEHLFTGLNASVYEQFQSQYPQELIAAKKYYFFEVIGN